MNDDLLSRIERTIDTLRPYIASHRGSVEVVDFDEADGVLLVLRDVTALAETLRMKSDFVANASHELRTPVAAWSIRNFM